MPTPASPIVPDSHGHFPGTSESRSNSPAVPRASGSSTATSTSSRSRALRPFDPSRLVARRSLGVAARVPSVRVASERRRGSRGVSRMDGGREEPECRRRRNSAFDEALTGRRRRFQAGQGPHWPLSRGQCGCAGGGARLVRLSARCVPGARGTRGRPQDSPAGSAWGPQRQAIPGAQERLLRAAARRCGITQERRGRPVTAAASSRSP